MLPNKHIIAAGNHAWSLVTRHGHAPGRAIELAIASEIPARTWSGTHLADRVVAIDAIIARYHARARLEIRARRQLEADRAALANPRTPKLRGPLVPPDPLPVRPFTGDRARRDASRSVREARPRWRYRPGPVVRLWMLAYVFALRGRARPALFRALLLLSVIAYEED